MNTLITISSELRAVLRFQCALEGRTMKEYIAALIRNDLLAKQPDLMKNVIKN
jgi:hypothetical protein